MGEYQGKTRPRRSRGYALSEALTDVEDLDAIEMRPSALPPAPPGNTPRTFSDIQALRPSPPTVTAPAPAAALTSRALTTRRWLALTLFALLTLVGLWLLR